jgi:hypothetical protein
LFKGTLTSDFLIIITSKGPLKQIQQTKVSWNAKKSEFVQP